MEKMNDLKDLLKHEIQDLYSVEEQIIAALPKMIEKANNKTLKKALSEHLKITEQQKKRLDQIQGLMNGSKQEEEGKKKGIFSELFGGSHVCKGMKGIIEEGNKVMGEDMEPKVMDAAIIACAQKVEHYEICGYGTARTYARELNLEPVAKLLEQTLAEEYEADDQLTELAVTRINLEAETAGGNSGDRSASGSRQRDTTSRARTQEKELEPVSNRKSSGSSTSKKASSARGGQPKSSGSAPRSNGTGRGAASTKKTASNSRSSKTSSRSSGNGRSSSGRGSSGSSRGRK